MCRPESMLFYRHTVCTKAWVQSVSYLQIVGIIIGQVGVGIIGDWVGRKWGLVQDACVMLLGSVMLTASWGLSLQGWVIMYTFSLFIFGIGVGGELLQAVSKVASLLMSALDAFLLNAYHVIRLINGNKAVDRAVKQKQECVRAG